MNRPSSAFRSFFLSFFCHSICCLWIWLSVNLSFEWLLVFQQLFPLSLSLALTWLQLQCCGVLPFTDSQSVIKNQGRKPYEIWFKEGKFKAQTVPESCCITPKERLTNQMIPGAIQQDQNRKSLQDSCNAKSNIYQEVRHLKLPLSSLTPIALLYQTFHSNRVVTRRWRTLSKVMLYLWEDWELESLVFWSWEWSCHVLSFSWSSSETTLSGYRDNCLKLLPKKGYCFWKQVFTLRTKDIMRQIAYLERKTYTPLSTHSFCPYITIFCLCHDCHCIHHK